MRPAVLMSAFSAQPVPDSTPPVPPVAAGGAVPPDAGSDSSGTTRETTGLTGARPIPPEALHRHHDDNPTGQRLTLLTLTALGVVYGDIGTSPLYAFRETFKAEYGLTPTPEHVYGVLSLILWALIFTVSVKYIGFIMRADNRGEGGIFALLALLLQGATEKQRKSRRRRAMIGLGLVGAALLYGDGVITPAISVLGAVEGLETISPAFTKVVVPLTLVIIVALFSVQKSGTDRIGRAFGPVMLLWFFTIAVLGVYRMLEHPGVLRSINPWWGFALLAEDPKLGFFLLGAVVLAVTGAEALYADMGHFGRRPIRLAWFGLVLPALMLNYFGQGALVLDNPTLVESNTFYALAPRWFLYPLLVLATLAAIVASQALISGAFSLTQQAIQLGYSPRMNVRHTSKIEAGQIYIPEVNVALGVGTVLTVLYFGSSSKLGAAYGIAVTGTMAITTLLFHRVMLDRWRWPAWRAWAITMAFVLVDLAFLGANVVKIHDGGWVPLAIGAALYLLMVTWKKGREELTGMMRRQSVPLGDFLKEIKPGHPHRVPGTAVFMTSDASGVPVVLLHHLKHNKVLHEQVILLSVMVEDVPEVSADQRLKIEALTGGFSRVVARYGFMQTPDVKDILQACRQAKMCGTPNQTTYYLGRERILVKEYDLATEAYWLPVLLHRWHVKLFSIMSRNARSAAEYFGIPPNRVVELGAQVEL
jgi:KUP system potassium uptake protein